MASLGDLMIRVGATIDGFSDAMKSVVSQASDAADAVADKLESIGDVGQRLAVLGGALTAAITLPLEEIGRRSIEVAGNFEQTQIAFTTMLGSSQAAKDKLAELYKFAQNTPFELPQVLAGARQITAFGFSSKDIIPILTQVGDTVSALGTGQAGMQQILSNLGKMKTAGKATADSLGDLGRDGVAAWQYLANALGKPLPVVQEMVTKREVSADTAINAILSGMHEQFGGLMSSQMQSFGGIMSNLADNVTMTGKAIGDVLLPAGKALLGWAQDALNSIKELAQWFGTLPAPVQAFAVAIAVLAAAVGPALVAIGGLGMALPMVSAGLTAIAGVFGISVVALAPWTIAIGLALAALTALGVWVYSNWAGIRASAVQIFDGLGEIWNTTVGGAVQAVITIVGGPLTGAWTTFKAVFMSIWDSISGVLHRAIDAFKSDLDDLIKVMEKIPGMAKLLSAGSAFDKGNADKSKSDRVEKAKRDLIDDGGEFKGLHTQADDWDQKHSNELKTASAELKTLKQALDEGAISAEQFHKASEKLAKLQAQKNPYNVAAASTGKAGKIDHNALDELSGAHAHEEAQLALKRSQIEHDYQMAKPGSAARVGESPEDQAKADIAAAEKRKAALDATYEDERKKTLKNLEDKLALYKGDQAGHEKLIQAKTAAEDRYATAIQKTTFDLETIKKQADDRIQAAHNKQIEDDLKAQQKSYEMAVKTVDLKVQAIDKETQFQIRQEQFNAGIRDKALQFELESGNLSKAQYLRLKQQQFDAAYAMEVQALEAERDLIESEFADLLDKAKTAEQRSQVMADRRKRVATVDDRQQQVENRHTGQTQDTQLGLARDAYDIGFKPIESGLSSSMVGLIEGTKTLGQAWRQMVSGMLNSWITGLAQMASRWAVHKAAELLLHTTTNQAKLGSDRATEGQSLAIHIASHLKKIAMKGIELVVHIATNIAKLASTIASEAAALAIHIASHLKLAIVAAKEAAMWAFTAVMHIPVIGPILAPPAAVAAYAGVMAWSSVSAEGGAVLPNHNTFGFLHPQEMVLPKPISVGLQNLIASGGLSNAGGIMNQTQGGSLSSTALQMMRNTAAAGDVSHTHNWGGITVHNSASSPITEDKVFNLMQGAMRRRNLQMA